MSASSPSPSFSPSGVPPTATVTPATPPESATPSSPPPSLPPVASPPPASPPSSATTPPPVLSPPPSTTNPPPPPNAPPPATPAPPLSDPPESPPPSTTNPPPPPNAPPPATPAPPLSDPPESPPPSTTNPPPPPNAPPPATPAPPVSAPSESPPQVSSPPPQASPPPSSDPPITSAPPPTSPPPPPPPSSSSAPPSSPPVSPPPVSQPPPPSSNQPATSPPAPPASSPPINSPPPAQEPATASIPPPPISHLSPPPATSTPSGSQPSTPSSTTPSPGNPTDSSKSDSGVPIGGIVAIGVVAGVLLLGLLGVIVWCIYKRRRRKGSKHNAVNVEQHSSSSPHPEKFTIKTEALAPLVTSGSVGSTPRENGQGGLGHSRSYFTYQELYESTNGFAAESLLGEGGFGFVYKGVLANGREVAVKKLKSYGEQGDREFKVEVEIIGRIHHRHLVSLVGYCIFESQRLLVYEYIPNQTLHYHLHGETRAVLDWPNRIKIAVGAARGLAYLHEDCHPRIIHRDIKSLNILLDDKFEARVSDFGLAKLVLDMDTHISTRVMGTFGYMAPEYATSGKLTEKSDVYSFGVVLLELITGRRPVDESQPLGDESLVVWARPLLNHALDTGQVEGLVDPKLENNFVESELFLMIEAAAACVRHSASKRPRMGQVLRAFDGLLPTDLSNGMRVGQSEIYDPAQQSEEIRWFRRMAFGSQDYSTDYFSEFSRNSNPNPTQGSREANLSSQHSKNQQPGKTIYFSTQRSSLPQNSDFSGHSSQNLDSSTQSSQNPTSSGHSSQNVDSSSRESRSR